MHVVDICRYVYIHSMMGISAGSLQAESGLFLYFVSILEKEKEREGEEVLRTTREIAGVSPQPANDEE